MSRLVSSICRCCSAGCGILVEVDGDRLIGVQGDPSHPASHGYLCQKGHRIPWFHHRPDRLDRPVLRGRPTTWDACLDDLAAHVRGVVDEDGPDAVGVYRASGTGGDAAGMLTLTRFLQGIGTRQHYSAMTVDHAPAIHAQELVTGSAELTPTWVPEDPEGRLVLFIGCNPVVSHGYMTILPDPIRRIRGFQKRGGQVWVVDPRRTQTAELADGHVRTRAGTDPVLLAWLVRELLASDAGSDELRRTTSAGDCARLAAALEPFDRATTARITGVPEEELDSLLKAVVAAGRIAVVTGTGLIFGPDGLVGEWLRWALMAVTGSLDVRGGMWFNPGWFSALEQRTPWVPAPLDGSLQPGPKSRPELPLILGEMPCVAMADEIEAGNLRLLIVAGGSPLTAFPEPERVKAALASLDALAVIDIVDSPLTEMATHVLPSASQMERTDIMAWNGRVCLSPRVLAPAADRRPLWEFFAGLGQRLGVDVLGGVEPEVATEELLIRQRIAGGRDDPNTLFAAGTHGVLPPRLYGWVAPYLPDGRWRIAPASMLVRVPGLLEPHPEDRSFHLVCRRITATKNSNDYLPIERLRDRPAVTMHPDDAAKLGIPEEEPVEVASDAGTVACVVRLDPTLPSGTVSLLHGSFTANVTRLTSAVAGVDPLTGEPVMTGIPVSIRPLGASG
jgi:anaerobic selenocysteine-containing dehydrogenase